jgi:chemotaxis protein methyltransferase CheR
MVSKEIVQYFADHIYRRLGIVYSVDNFYQLEGRLTEIAKNLKYDSIEKLYENLKKGLSLSEERILLDTATNNETLFFRDGKVYSALEKIFDELCSYKDRSSHIRVWSAASSTGQEPYSLAMLLCDRLPKMGDQKFFILASDISERVLEYAKKGVYEQLEIQRGLPALKLATYFEEASPDMTHTPKWQIQSRIREYMDFKKINLKEWATWPQVGLFDVILCRNVLIYQDIANKKQIVEQMVHQLKEGGYLILGGSESLIGITDQLEMTHFDGAIFYRKINKKVSL